MLERLFLALHEGMWVLRCRSLTLWRQEGKEDQGITFVQVRFGGYGTRFSTYLVSSIGTLQWYRYPNSTLESAYRYRYSGTSIGTPLEISLVSIHGKEYRYPSSLMELEYRNWLSSTGIGCLRTVFGVP
ncbi:hypothetical protein GQ457_07G009860 [Hibiscus cannabinus]